MAYQAKRTSEYVQEFELVDESGRVVHSMKVALDPGSMVEKLSRQYVNLLHAKEEVGKIQANSARLEELTNGYQTLGDAAMAMISSVFGEEDTKTIFEFYRGRYNDIVQEVLPFITTVVLPDIRHIAQQNRKDVLQKYNRKQRRTISKVWGKDGLFNRNHR